MAGAMRSAGVDGTLLRAVAAAPAAGVAVLRRMI